MKRSRRLTFKIASEEMEFEQIYKLNYKTFVEEVPQHEVNSGRTLIDKFDTENAYVICLRAKRLVGMVAVRGQRPFSLDQKLGNLDEYLPKGRSLCEIRLLAVDRRCRNGIVLRGLLKLLCQHCGEQRYDLAVISGALSQLRLYRTLGFVPFGPLVGNGKARFQPMYLSLEEFEKHGRLLLAVPSSANAPRKKIMLLPGPVAVRADVRKAFIREPVSHRSEHFMRNLDLTKKLLSKLVNCQQVEILVGTGTLANDVIAGQLSLQAGCGLILTNGEFGNRLIDHARRFDLSFDVYDCAWGEPFDSDRIRRQLERSREARWLWAVHCETSTGMLNDLATLKAISSSRGMRLCLDCVSSVGTVPVELSGVYLASGVSGKGLGAFPGLSMIFYSHDILPAPSGIPRYLDVGLYAAEDGVPFTASSNLLYALQGALLRFQTEDLYERIRELSRSLRSMLRDLGFEILTSDVHAAPAVITIVLPHDVPSVEFGEKLEREGYWLSYKSRYLLARNWIQICLMGDCGSDDLGGLLNAFQRLRDDGRFSRNRAQERFLTTVSS
jgi:aspartate aminotransferase-like enzyme